MISAIVAVAENNVIGKNNQLIWHMPADMKFFKDKTTGHCIITGRKNYESIPEKFRPLPNRTNIIITRKQAYVAPGALVVHSVDEALEVAKQKGDSEIFIIGGAEIYKQCLGFTERVYLTRIHHTFEGDAFFPELDVKGWKLVSQQDHQPDEKNKYPYSFCVFERF